MVAPMREELAHHVMMNKMTPQLASDRRVLFLFPVFLASFFLVGTLRLVSENYHLIAGGTCLKLFRSLSTKEELKRRVFLNSPNDSISVKECNVFEGTWVIDGSHPLYREEDCPYLTKQVTCQRNGRPDSLYQKWRWEPDECNLPRFDAVNLLEILRDKRLMMIGDSLQRTQWESLVCLLESAIPDGKKSLKRRPPMKIFRAEEFNVSIEFYWAPFIVESNSDHATKHTVKRRLVHLDSLAKHSTQWAGVDVLVFESYVWWMYKPTVNVTVGSLENVQEYNVTAAYQIALRTWASWVESSINPRTQKLFFMSLSPTHLWSWEWKPGSDQNCFNETYPIQVPYWGTGSSIEMMDIVGETLTELSINVTLLNITQLSEYRKDGHTTVYTERRGKLLTPQQKSDPKNFADCIHWCLPGVPDTWNEILYAYLMHDFLLNHGLSV